MDLSALNVNQLRALPATVDVVSEMARRRENQRAIICHHEAGHAVVGYHFSFVIVKMAFGRDAEAESKSGIAQGFASGGHTLVDFGNDDPAGPHVALKAEAIACQKLAGHIASKLFAQDVGVKLAANDYDSARTLLRENGRKECGLQGYVKELEMRTVAIAERQWRAVSTIARELIARTTLPGRRATAILEMTYEGIRPPTPWRS